MRIRQILVLLSLAPAYLAGMGQAEAQLPSARLGPAASVEVGEDRAYSSVASLRPVGAPAGPSRFSDYKWLAGKMIFSVKPPDNLSDMQKTEWMIGYMAGAADLCGNYGKAAKVRALMSRSPYFKDGRSHILGYDFVENCGRISSALEEVLERKEQWEAYLDAVYPGAPLGSGSGDRTTGDAIRQIAECQGKTSRADERLRLARLAGYKVAGKFDATVVVESSILTCRSRSVPGAFIFLARDETKSDTGRQWTAACKAPEPTQYVTGSEGLYRSCLRDAAIIECLEDSHGWMRLSDRPGMIRPPSSLRK